MIFSEILQNRKKSIWLCVNRNKDINLINCEPIKISGGFRSQTADITVDTAIALQEGP